MKGNSLFLLISVLFFSCTYKAEELFGVYVPNDYKNTFDTIQLNENKRYNRRVYDKNKKLVLEIQGQWDIKGDVIEFKAPYFFNLDRDLVEFPELLQDTISNGIGIIWKKKNTLEFCIGHLAVDLPDQNCYKKQ